MPKDFLQQFTALRDSLKSEREQIQQRLDAINKALGGEIPGPFMKTMGGGEVPSPFSEGQTRKRRGGMSAAGRARIAEAQRRRWAALKGGESGNGSPVTKGSGRRRMSPAARARIAAAARARWKKAKAAGRNAL